MLDYIRAYYKLTKIAVPMGLAGIHAAYRINFHDLTPALRFGDVICCEPLLPRSKCPAMVVTELNGQPVIALADGYSEQFKNPARISYIIKG